MKKCVVCKEAKREDGYYCGECVEKTDGLLPSRTAKRAREFERERWRTRIRQVFSPSRKMYSLDMYELCIDGMYRALMGDDYD